MPPDELIELWRRIEDDLQQAAGLLPLDVRGTEQYHDYTSFLEHNELELACTALEAAANHEEYTASAFWELLACACDKMELTDRAQRYRLYALHQRDVE